MDDPTLRTLLDTYSKMYATEEEVAEETTEEPEELSEACWKGYKQEGLKKKGERMVPNCVPEAYDIVLDYLISEGLASDVESADKIMLVMSEEKIKEIVAEDLASRARSVVDDQRAGSHGMADDLNKTRKALDKLKPYPGGFPAVKGV